MPRDARFSGSGHNNFHSGYKASQVSKTAETEIDLKYTRNQSNFILGEVQILVNETAIVKYD